MKLGAIGCLRRALANSFANWELLLAQWVLGAAGMLLAVAGFLPLLAVFAERLPALREVFAGDPAAALDDLGRLAAASWPGWGALLVALALATLVWTLSLSVFCFLLAGTYGTLMAGERQVPRGAPQPWRAFRAFAVRDFVGWGRRYSWRYFWAVQAFFAVGALWLLSFALVAFAAAWAGAGWGAVAAVGVGCGGALPLAFLAFVMALWFAISMADLARAGAGVWEAMRNGLAWLGGRPGTVLLLFLLQLAASFAISLVFAPISMFGSLALRDAPGGDLMLQGAVGFAQWLVSAGIGLASSAAFVAFVRECAEEG